MADEGAAGQVVRQRFEVVTALVEGADWPALEGSGTRSAIMFLVELNWLQDAGFLRRVGRDALALVLERLSPVLEQQGLALPEAGLPDAVYFRRLAELLRAQSVKVAVRDSQKTKAAREEAKAELEQIRAFLAKDSRQRRDQTKAAGDAVRSAIKKLLRNLLTGSGSAANPESVQCEFAWHLQRHLVSPSRRYAVPKARKARGELTGCLLYEPPPGVLWIISQPKAR